MATLGRRAPSGAASPFPSGRRRSSHAPHPRHLAPSHAAAEAASIRRRRSTSAHGRGSTAARTWLDLQLDIADRGRSDAPRLPAHQVERLYPNGAPRSWGLLIDEPKRPAWVLRTLAGLVGVGLGVATAVSETVSGIVATTVAGFGEMATIGLHLLGLVASVAHLGLVGRLVSAVAIAVLVARLGWRLARWGAAPIGEDR